MDITFKSTSKLIVKVINQLEKGMLRNGDTLSIVIPPEQTSLPDLFAIGRLLAFVRELKSQFDIETEFIFKPPKRIRSSLVKSKSQALRNIENLNELGFFHFCQKNGIRCEFTEDPQLSLPSAIDENKDAQDKSMERNTYWKCLVPLQSHPLPKQQPLREREVVNIIGGFIKEFSDQAQAGMGEFDFDFKDVGLELSRILYILVRELLSNTITHSGETEFLFAMTISRQWESETQSHRPGIILPSGQDKFDLLLMDLGRGISRTVAKTLSGGNDELSADNYFSLSKWEAQCRLSKAKEESLLTNIFRGELVIRKGRKSEGLYELGQTLRWFGGMLNLFTGRSELQVSAVDGEELVTKHRQFWPPYYLPGVIASAILPSHQVKTTLLKGLARKQAASQTEVLDRRCEVRRFQQLPNGLFGGSSSIKIRRRSELDAELIISEYMRETGQERDENHGIPFFWDVNLKVSDNIDVNFIDSFIQELCKRIDYIELSDSKNFYKLIFTNVPRNIIKALRQRNCASFLMLKETFCLLLDEADEPHFLGVPRVSNSVFDVEEALSLIFHSGLVNVDQLSSRQIGMTSLAIDHLRKLVGSSTDSIFSIKSVDGHEAFVSFDIISALRRARYESAQKIKSLRLHEDNAVFKLRNGAYVDSIYDFYRQWSDEEALIDCTKLLLSEAGFPLADTLLAFMNNGDRLAAAIQRFTKTPNLIIIDPHDNRLWANLEIEGDCILVVDALYPGDDQGGYVRSFIQYSELSSKYRIKQLWAFYDFREESVDQSGRGGQDEGNSTLAGLKVITVLKPDDLPRPRSVVPSKNDNILQNYQNYILTKPIDNPADDNRSQIKSNWYQYSPIELSTEFWQNVSALGIVDSKRTGRETRNVLFYENNEKLIQSPRMRRLVSEFVADYIKNVLDLRVDVILHPTHPVGSFLAQLVAAQLNVKPLVLPLTQRRYGGQIELTTGDYLYNQRLVENFKKARGREQLLSLIVDDSVLTGASLFTMLGVASKLGLKNNGILVLLSRLRPEISNALALFHMNYAYLYRLHMPVLTRHQSPDRKLNELNEDEKFIALSKSYFSQLWMERLKSEDSHFQPKSEVINTECSPTVKLDTLGDIKGSNIETYRLKQIIQHLILHPDPHILDFYIRVAIAYNFLEQLVQEEAFWKLLKGLFESDDSLESDSQSILLLRKILYILAFSKHIHPLNTYKTYQHLCCNLIDQCFRNGTWLQHKELVTDCLMWLGVIGSEKLLEVGPAILNTVLQYAFEDLSEIKGSESVLNEEPQDQTTARRAMSVDMLSAFAWALHVYIHLKGFSIIDNGGAFELLDSITRSKPSGEKNLLLIDMLEPVISASPRLRSCLGITEWPSEENFMQGLMDNNYNNKMMWYLKEAPGYTVTLKTLLRICKADTVLLYAKNKLDEQYFLRVFDTRQNKRADDDLGAEHFAESYLPDEIRERMVRSVFFSSTRPEHAGKLNDFSKDASHLWCMGGAVISETSGVSYYVILGYWKRPPDPAYQSTAYYYWLKCEALLRLILPRIHSKYVESATEWNAQVQSIRPVHPIKSNDPSRSELVNSRRKIISYAMTNADIGDLLRRAVRMFTEPVYRLLSIRNEVGIICKNVRLFVISELQENRNKQLAEQASLRADELPPFVPEVDALTPEQESTFCALHMALLKFIAYECLWNALAYFHKLIYVKLKFDPGTDADHLIIKLIVANDIHPSAVSADKPIKPIGISACKMATAAVGGHFNADYDRKSRLWIATTELPAHKVPDELRRQLHGLLK